MKRTHTCWLCEHNDDGATPAVELVRWVEAGNRRAHWLCADCARIIRQQPRGV